MTDKLSGNRINIAAGVVGLATAVLGLAGAAMGMFDGKESVAPAPEVVARTAGPAPEAIDQSGLNGRVPPVIDGYISGPAFIDIWADKRLCYEFEESTSSCTVISMLTQRGPREVRVQETFFRPLTPPIWDTLEQMVMQDMEERSLPRPVAYFRADYNDFLITREGICTTTARRAETAALTEVVASTDAGFAQSTPVSRETLREYRAAWADSLQRSSVGGQLCWRYKIPADVPNVIDQYYFIDGVMQPAVTYRFYLTPNDSGVGLRLPS